MALILNGYRLGFSPFVRRIGALVSIYNGGGDLHTGRNCSGLFCESLFGEYAGRPIGNLHPESWAIPQRAGAMSMRASGSGTLAANLYPTRAMSIDLTGFGDLEATGALIISMFAALSGSGSLTATIEGRLDMSADLEGSGDLTADMEGVASMACAMLGSGDLEATIAAYGNMEIDIVVTGTGLTTANVGQVVWSSILANYADTGNAASALQTAGSGGVDYSALWASMPTELKESLAEYVRLAALADPFSANVKEVNDVTITGAGITGNSMRPA